MEDLKQGACSASESLEKVGTWYYVVDCATCKETVPFKYAPEGEPILLFPTMIVRCFHCGTHHTYAPDLISYRKASAPHRIFDGDREPSHASDDVRETARERQEDHGKGDSGGSVIKVRKIDPITASLRCKNILNVAVGRKRAMVFFFSSGFFSAAWLLQVALNTFYASPVAAINEVRSSGPAMLLGTMFFGTVLLGLLLFIFGLGSIIVEAFGFKGGLIKRGFARIVSSIAVRPASRKFPTRELLRALAGRTWQGRTARTKTTGAKHDF